MTTKNELVINYANELISDKELLKDLSYMLYVYNYREYFADAVYADKDLKGQLGLADDIHHDLKLEMEKHLDQISHKVRCLVNENAFTGKEIIYFVEKSARELSHEIRREMFEAYTNAKKDIAYFHFASKEDSADNMSA